MVTSEELSNITVTVFFIGLAIGAVATGLITASVFKAEAIEAGVAKYDAKTGKWDWKPRTELIKDLCPQRAEKD